MKRRYVIAVEGLSAAQEEEFIAYIREKRLGWWHWIANFWLIIDRHSSVKASDLRDKLIEIGPPPRCIVMEVGNTLGWAGRRNRSEMFDWFRKSWLPDD